MENGPKYTLIFSGVIIVISVILMIFGSAVDVDVESEAVFRGSEGTVSLSDKTTYTVFVNDQYNCYDTDIVVTDGTWDYFDQDCDEYMDEEGWKHAGTLSMEASDNLEVSSNHEIIIVDDVVYLESGGSIIVGACACCAGIIGIIIGGIWSTNSSKGQPVAQMVILPQQQAPAHVPVQVPVTTNYTPGDLVITQLEEEHDV
jgi:hypothetical protein